MKSAFWKVALLALPMAACSTMHISTNAAPGAAQTVSRYHTYAWLPTPPERSEPRKDPFVEAHVKQSVDRELAAKGYRKVASSADPDFLVGWHTTTEERTRVESINPYWGYDWGPAFGPPLGYGGAAGPDVYVSEYVEGTMILDVVDGRTNTLVWRGSAQADLGANPSGEEVPKKIDKAADKILSKFPPQE